MFEHHASYVIMGLLVKATDLVADGNTDEGIRLIKLCKDVSAEFPEANAEINARYPTPTAQEET